MTGMFRTGWQMDYPSIENFLVPLYKTGASSNDGDWSNKKFDDLMDEASAKAGQEGIDLFQQGEAVLAEDMPVIPMWYGAVVAGYSDTVTNVQFTPFSRVNLLTIENALVQQHSDCAPSPDPVVGAANHPMVAGALSVLGATCAKSGLGGRWAPVAQE